MFTGFPRTLGRFTGTFRGLSTAFWGRPREHLPGTPEGFHKTPDGLQGTPSSLHKTLQVPFFGRKKISGCSLAFPGHWTVLREPSEDPRRPSGAPEGFQTTLEGLQGTPSSLRKTMPCMAFFWSREDFRMFIVSPGLSSAFWERLREHLPRDAERLS